MISSIRGEVLSIGLDHAVVEVGGVGITVYAVPDTLATLRGGQQVRLCTTLVVREDSLTLYGFADEQARELFGLLQTVSGIGPRLAMATLAVLAPPELRSALSESDYRRLTQVPGIGRKGAERLVVELRDKVAALADAGTGGPAGRDVRAEVSEALTGLGFAGKAAEQAVDAVLAEDAAADSAAVLRSALTRLGSNR